jgi:hypothetical protein
MLTDTQLRKHISAHIPSGQKRRAFEILKNGIELAREHKLPTSYDYSSGKIKVMHHVKSGRPKKNQQGAIIASALATAYLACTGSKPNLSNRGYEVDKTPFELFAGPVLIGEGHKDVDGILKAHTKTRNNPLDTCT